MQRKLYLPNYNFRITTDSSKKRYIFDSIRKKSIVLTPEEWVRQNFIQYLIHEKGYRENLISVEKKINSKRLNQRSDIVIYNSKGQAKLIVECKAPEVKLTQEAFDQIARYNMTLKVNFLIITNGLQHYCCIIKHDIKEYSFIDYIPDYQEICI